MSGPKVVRIVTREESIAICKRLLARSDKALEEWIRVGQRYDCLNESAIAAARERTAQMAALLASDRFIDVQKQAQAEVMFLRSDIETRLADAAARKGAKRARELRKTEAAAALLSTLRKAGKPIDPTLEGGIKRADDKAMSEGFAMLGSDESATDNAALAQADLLRGGNARDIEEWVGPPNPVIERLEVRLANLAQLVGEDGRIPAWEQRIRQAELEPDRARRNLLVDSLEVDLGRATTAARDLANLRDEFQLLIAEAKATEGLSTIEYEQLLASSASREALESGSASCSAAIAQHQTAVAAKARRAAVLQGLAGLGYEVSEGMSTLWVEQGRVVLRKAAMPEYGVEIAGNGDTGRLQIRAIAFSDSDTDPRNDKDVETKWCGDVTKLTAQLENAGTQLTIERALPIGQVPLKRVAQSGLESSRDSQIDAPKRMRQLP